MPEIMLIESNIQLTLIHHKNRSFALTFENISDNIALMVHETNQMSLSRFDQDRIKPIQKIYKNIIDLKDFSLENILMSFGIDCEKPTPLFFAIKRKMVREYGKIVQELIAKTIVQIQRNINKVNVCFLAYEIFYQLQPFPDSETKFTCKDWNFGNNARFNNAAKDVYENFVRADAEKKNDPQFCVDSLVNIFTILGEACLSSSKVDFIDRVVDNLYGWYFIESEQSYDYLIFNPDAFDDVIEFLKNAINNNSFSRFICSDEDNMFKIRPAENCLESNNLICLPDAHYNLVNDPKSLESDVDRFFNNYKNFAEHGMYNINCYDLSKFITKNFIDYFKDNPSLINVVLPHLNSNNIVKSYPCVIENMDTFIENFKKDPIHHKKNRILA
ncbi:TPA: hypothetical protein ACJEU7_002461 [Acinetobacter baumannii]|uniref:hypothetical protein n=1 Tax=Acinetobacter baumannii TaxID=470 RepID=UPI002255E01F|nr:hypothetical protein [Acinetobacter baumannii]MCX3034237.1 hypothetical protein [Acinetobacter baumannii]